VKNIGLIVAALGLMVMAACGRTEESAAASARLPELPLDPAAVTVSGISAGGYMAVQFHVAHSALVRGAGIVAAGPYFCAEASLRHALGRCMQGDEEIPTARLLETTSQLGLEGAIDPIAGLADDRVWIFHGAADPVVSTPVVDALEAYYHALVSPEQVARVEHPEAGHTFPTRRPDGLVEFDQRPYAASSGSAALAEQGWLYVPAACKGDAAAACRLHVVFHGCKQGASFVGDQFVRRSGYLEAAEVNRIVMLFPQIEPSFQPLNPNGCWDWWGYEDEAYATQAGPQVRAVRSMIADLLGEPTAAAR
jgi:poly(3-hydroxybutyrate) depolymerase